MSKQDKDLIDQIKKLEDQNKDLVKRLLKERKKLANAHRYIRKLEDIITNV